MDKLLEDKNADPELPFSWFCAVSQSRVSEAHSSWPLTDWTQPVQRIRQEGWEACRVSILLDYPHVLLSWAHSSYHGYVIPGQTNPAFQRPLSLSFRRQKSRSPQEPEGFNLYFWLCWTGNSLSPARQGILAFSFHLLKLFCIPGTDNYRFPPLPSLCYSGKIHGLTFKTSFPWLGWVRKEKVF